MEHKGITDLGKLYMIPTTLGDTAPLEVLPISIKRTIEEVNHYIVENEKTARRFIKSIKPSKSQPDLHIELLNKFTEPLALSEYLNPCLEGKSVGLLSEAGCPGIADPGADIVKIAHEKRIQVVPLVGPSAILMAMMASGMNGQSFAFNGYLPIDKTERRNTIKRLEKLSQNLGQSQIFIETPYRNNKLKEELIQTLRPNTLLCIASDITLSSEFIKTMSAAQWVNNKEDFHKRPAIFIIQA
ncbi:Uroporphyrin-III C/tetrapyrrole (Corrin/Porphyrin) methyltransferase [Croceitalea dokdonensis DOKDO 023]|uniref:Uroporphyrin-III C/tetrapyrrole (Corrin/Porphyrin) methyltransferase n=1 Tax=Croceitalea dokdonensis DOKDO 023 TaxID=1300341 RepID=A0A0P7AJA4_9FLAO|nr:SAM-dependent methyltransferase [Croceitalea dokdonensis]KPM33696.1 Uroporphyrin-III C/tetrapyrrole (Corrin/Porphyrin) methyltransferase [Croceitalea dokdonensis DOKDO 023]